MKKFLLLIFLLIITSVEHSMAQSSDFLLDGLKWFYRGQYVHEEYKIDGSKTLNGKDYKLLTVIRGGYDSRVLLPGSPLMNDVSYDDYIRATIGIREDNGRIYVDKDEYLSLLTEEHPWINVVEGEPLPYETTAEGELVLYDFTKKEGEVYLQMDGGTTLTVTKNHILKTEDGVTRRCLTLSNGFEIIEGVGSINSPGMLLFWLNMKPEYNDYGAMINFRLYSTEGSYVSILAQDIEAIKKKQSGHPSILQQGRRWVYDYDNDLMKGTLTYSMEGDTLNQGYKGYKIQMTLKDNTDQIVKSCYAGALFEKLGEVTYLAPGKAKDEPLYCFDTNLTRMRPNGYSLMIVNSDNIKVGDKYYNRFLLVNKRDSVPLEKDSLYYWVEGIGSSRGLLEYAAGELFDSIKFVACYDGEKCIFTKDDFTIDSDNLSMYDGYLEIGGLRYYVDLSKETASVTHSYLSTDSIVVLSSVRIWGVDCNVVGISGYAFNNCTNLKSVTLPLSIVSIGNHAFGGCTNIESVTLPQSIVSIDSYAFSECTNLKSVILPQSIISIGDFAFQKCGLTEVVLPDNVKSIGASAFTECSDLVSVSFPRNFSSIRRGTFNGCTSLQSVTFPEYLDTIGGNAFAKCTSLKRVDLPASLTMLENGVFQRCENLSDVYCRAMTPPNTFGLAVFRYISPEATLHVPNEALQAYKEAVRWAEFKYIVPIEEDTDAIMVQKSEPDTHLLFDLQGRPVKDTPTHGIYVKDGRKVIR